MNALSVLLSSGLVADGQVPAAQLGDRVGYALRFQDQPLVEGDELARTFEVRASLLRDGRARQSRNNDGSPRGRPTYLVYLQADNWAATWRSEAPIEGAVTVHGLLFVVAGSCPGTASLVRGTVVALREVIETMDTSAADPARWRAVPGLRVLHDATRRPEPVSEAVDDGRPLTDHAREHGRWVPFRGDDDTGPVRYRQRVVDLAVG